MSASKFLVDANFVKWRNILVELALLLPIYKLVVFKCMLCIEIKGQNDDDLGI